jgi:hypothetical protein
MARANQVVAFTQADNVLTFTVAGQPPIEFDMDKAHAALRIRAEVHGWKQRLSDKAAMSRDTKTGAAASPAEKAAAIRALAEYYMSGASEWNMRGAAGGRKSESAWIIEALIDLDLYSEERIATAAAKYEMTVDAYLARLATTDRVAKRVAELKHGASDLDADEMLDDLEG